MGDARKFASCEFSTRHTQTICDYIYEPCLEEPDPDSLLYARSFFYSRSCRVRRGRWWWLYEWLYAYGHAHAFSVIIAGYADDFRQGRATRRAALIVNVESCRTVWMPACITTDAIVRVVSDAASDAFAPGC